MPVINREFDFSEQVIEKSVLVSTAVGASAGNSYHVAHVAQPGVLKGVAIAAASISGAPNVSLDIKRYTATGVTTIPDVGTTLAVLAYGASTPYQMITLASAGSTLLNVHAGDVVVLRQNFSGGNVAIGGAIVTTCFQALQDIKQHFSISQ